MLIKAVVLVLIFSGALVALSKPFNIKAVSLMAALVISILVLGFAPGFTRVLGALGIILSLLGLYVVRGKK